MTITEQEIVEVTCSAPVNIAVIKYWGKRDSELVLPVNSSLSVTLNQDHLRSTTTLRLQDSTQKDSLFLNGDLQLFSSRLQNVLQTARDLRRDMELADPSLKKLSDRPVRIVSKNNFPTAAGLASSASGLACLAYSLAQIFDIPQDHISRVARLGSGSACRSVYGGFVGWEMGIRPDGSDSQAYQVAPHSHWSDLKSLILVVSDARKDTPSTSGMQTTVNTSPLLAHRTTLVPDLMARMETAIKNKQFDDFAEITMRDSNQFHACCLDTFPPIFYLTQTSHAIIALVHAYNNLYTKLVDGKMTGYRCAYTFDAGPNAVLYFPEQHAQEIMYLINTFFPTSLDLSSSAARAEYFGRAEELLGSTVSFSSVCDEIKGRVGGVRDGIKRVIYTGVGDGPRVLASRFDPLVSLMDVQGNPLP